MKREFYLKCDCEQEMLTFTKYANEPELWISYWTKISKPFIGRVSLAFRILFNKEVNLWDIVLSKEKQNQLKEAINRLC